MRQGEQGARLGQCVEARSFVAEALLRMTTRGETLLGRTTKGGTLLRMTTKGGTPPRMKKKDDSTALLDTCGGTGLV